MTKKPYTAPEVKPLGKISDLLTPAAEPPTFPTFRIIVKEPEPKPVPVAWVCAHHALGKAWRELAAGTAVIVQRDNGSMLETWTTDKPRELGGQPVVDCEGIAGPYHLRNVYLRAKR